MGRHYLVTGAAGFVGMHVAATLAARGDRVTGIDNFNPYYDVALKEARARHLTDVSEGRAVVERCDFSDRAALDAVVGSSRYDGIVHLGAQPGVRYSLTHPMTYGQANLIGHLTMLELARAQDCPHFVYASSSSVYGDAHEMPLSESRRVDHPISLYAATKRACELMSESYAHLYRMPQTGLRFFTVYGPWGRPDMAAWLFADAVLEGRPIKLFNEGRLERDFTYIDDIVAGIIAALDSPPQDDGSKKTGGSTTPHRIWNIGNNQPEPLENLVTAVEKACGRPAIRELVPMQPGDVTRTYADIDAIRAETDFEPRTGLEEGIGHFVNWFQQWRAGAFRAG